MAGRADKAAAFLKSGGDKAKAGGSKIYALAKDPEMQAKAMKLLEDGKKMYRAATSPEAKQAYRQAAEIINKARKK
ncbi:hypothetical protein NG702_19120 [Pseudarthrobacter sp. MDT3-28]|uniref:hypothetical protein n=1 Tax=Pseudarthrobacter raffinosi TaxID=2953651 RepID=UPI00208FAA03|nr:hypothetical protein [Pseudarthrobacter sp. MDT3-28]MCO4239487.1 hypothetical protein [Pseudarthrobacter sp. MDT3-28]